MQMVQDGLCWSPVSPWPFTVCFLVDSNAEADGVLAAGGYWQPLTCSPIRKSKKQSFAFEMFSSQPSTIFPLEEKKIFNGQKFLEFPTYWEVIKCYQIFFNVPTINVSVTYLYYKCFLFMFLLTLWRFSVLLSRSKPWCLFLQRAISKLPS